MEKAFDPYYFTNSIPWEIFLKHFICELGLKRSFSKLRCDGESRMSQAEWLEIETGYRNLGAPALNHRQMVELAYALTARAVKTRS